MDQTILHKAKRFFMGGGQSTDPLAEELGDGGTALSTHDPLDMTNSLSRALVGAVGGVGDYHFPLDLIGGCCPRIVGEEEDIAWNAAAEASDTERVHLIWHAKGDKIWYLAVRSSEMSSYTNTWCPFGSVLPGMKDAADPPTVYTYFSDEAATMMTVLVDGLQIHRGTSSVVRAKAERVSRELDGAPVIELVPDRIAKLTPIPWYSLSLFEERARRILAACAVVSSVVFAALGVVIWFIAAMATVSAHADLREIQQKSEIKSLALLKSVQAQRASPMREQLAQFADVNDGLLSLNGYLEVYQIVSNRPVWRAVLPVNVTSDRINELGGKTLDNNDLGVVVGSSLAALNIGKAK
ncbi:MAG: hypothetical protein PHD48_10585 [Alphaproteobacteria bacterium]|nr:hypothetical protein [Alphaproteobacteria bacterium]